MECYLVSPGILLGLLWILCTVWHGMLWISLPQCNKNVIKRSKILPRLETSKFWGLKFPPKEDWVTLHVEISGSGTQVLVTDQPAAACSVSAKNWADRQREQGGGSGPGLARECVNPEKSHSNIEACHRGGTIHDGRAHFYYLLHIYYLLHPGY